VVRGGRGRRDVRVLPGGTPVHYDIPMPAACRRPRIYMPFAPIF